MHRSLAKTSAVAAPDRVSEESKPLSSSSIVIPACLPTSGKPCLQPNFFVSKFLHIPVTSAPVRSLDILIDCMSRSTYKKRRPSRQVLYHPMMQSIRQLIITTSILVILNRDRYRNIPDRGNLWRHATLRVHAASRSQTADCKQRSSSQATTEAGHLQLEKLWKLIVCCHSSFLPTDISSQSPSSELSFLLFCFLVEGLRCEFFLLLFFCSSLVI